jgi:hypothetical protein
VAKPLSGLSTRPPKGVDIAWIDAAHEHLGIPK